MSSQIRGVVPPLAIPLKNGELDVASLERHINRMIGAGLNGLFVSGSTGEVAFSTSERRQQIQREVVRIVDGRVPLLVGVIDTETERVIENIKAVEEIGGALGVVATAPFYALGGQAEIEKHFRILKENTNLELWAYDIPVCVHTKLQNDLVLRLGKEGGLPLALPRERGRWPPASAADRPRSGCRWCLHVGRRRLGPRPGQC